METGPSRARDRVVDGVLVVLAAAFGYVAVVNRLEIPGSVPPGVLYLDQVAGVLGCVALWWRRRFPVALAAVLIALSTFAESLGGAAMVALFTVAVHRPARVTAVMTGLSLLANGVYQLLRPEIAASQTVVIAFLVAVHVAAVAWGLVVRSRRQLVASLRERAAAAEVEASLRAERVQHEARETLAREMHDVLGHRLSLLSVHAGALAYHRHASVEDVGRSAEVIRENAHRALQDLREVIGVLRAPVGELPLPGIADIAELIDETDRTGTPVELRDDAGVTTADREVPSTVGRTLYRLVQEGLTNVRKHAPGAPVVVRITGAPGDHLEAEIVNDRAPAPSSEPGGHGEGLRGLTERAALVGGRVEHGPTGDGGWRVGMRLPWPV